MALLEISRTVIAHMTLDLSLRSSLFTGCDIPAPGQGVTVA